MFLALFWEPRQHILKSFFRQLLCASGSKDSQLMGRSLPLLAFSILAGGLGCLSDLTYWHPGSRRWDLRRWGLGRPRSLPLLRAFSQVAGDAASSTVYQSCRCRTGRRDRARHCFTQKCCLLLPGMSLGNFVVLGLSTVQAAGQNPHDPGTGDASPPRLCLKFRQVTGRSVDNPRFGVTNFFVLAALFQRPGCTIYWLIMDSYCA